MNQVHAAVLLTASLALTSPGAFAQGTSPTDGPRFTSEPISEFQTAYAHHSRGVLDRTHADRTRYHAFRFRHSGTVLVGVAKRITVDSTGQIHIVGEPGTVMYGHRATSGGEYSHILMPVGVSPP